MRLVLTHLTNHSKLSLNSESNGCYVTHATSSVTYSGSSNSWILKQSDSCLKFCAIVDVITGEQKLENGEQKYNRSSKSSHTSRYFNNWNIGKILKTCCNVVCRFLFPHYNVYMQLLVGPSTHSTDFPENITTDPHSTHSPEKTTACYAHLNPSALEQFPSVTDTSRLTCVEFGLGMAVEFRLEMAGQHFLWAEMKWREKTSLQVVGHAHSQFWVLV